MKVINVRNLNDGIKTAKDMLYQNCGKDTVLFLSGGKTPKPLYEELAKEQKLKVGAVAMVDDRYSMHQQYSNEFMIRESGLISFLEKENIPFYPILKYGLNRMQTAREYNKDVEFLFGRYKKKIAILGIGSDGHIASLPAGEYQISNKQSLRSGELIKYQILVTDIDNFPAEIRERITLTSSAISKMDLIIVLAFGTEKKEGIKIALKTFFSGKEISKKTLLITDQPVSPLARRGGKL